METVATLPVMPAGLEPLAGQIIDVDSHEMMPVQEWLDYFGPDVQPLIDAWTATGEAAGPMDKNHPNDPTYAGDVKPIDDDIVNVKGVTAPGAVLTSRRLDVMDKMGVSKQLMFPGSVGLYGTILRVEAHDHSLFPTIGPTTERRIDVANRCIARYQEWLEGLASFSPRVRPVAPIAEDTVDGIIATARRLIDSGLRAIWLPAGIPPGGVSPAHSSLDGLWAMCAEADVTVTLHIGGEGKLLESDAWARAEPFEGFRSLGEFSVDPYSTSMLHIPFQNFLTAMVTGGVFARHPRLRFGVIEVGGHWIGPLMENMDMWAKNMGHMSDNPHKLTELPSTYVKNNVRVSFFPFEPVDVYLQRHDVADVLAFSTDYPHVEGGRNAVTKVYGKVEPFGRDVVEKIFRDNGKWLLP
ncbi:amidohydrolase family protein [Mycobacterium saskatchewanense]|uniref:amidohydrolase family protein n=1 Tax=Mycobacterium saskatchewanense TaxID=220927 RepID=UPI0013027515|nr:amidohydrolase family protein [Mycobacterium saskatchewanense]